MATKTKNKNILVQYKGGGYDGCFWEWNYFIFDSNGEFHNLISTGRNGVKSESEAIEEMNEDGTYIYDLTKESDIKDFQSECNAVHVVGLVQELNENYDVPEVYFHCDHCDAKVTEGGSLDGWHGCGGIAITADDKYCEDCYSSGSCSECGEFDLEMLNEGGCICEYCFEKKSKEFFGDQDGIYLEFNKLSNQFTELDLATDIFEFSELCIDGEKLFKIEVKMSGGTKNYFINGIEEKTAIQDLLNYLDCEYYGLAVTEVDNALIEEH